MHQIGMFDWDSGNREKCQSHGVSIGEIEALFARPVAVFPDPAHSLREERFIAVGVTDDRRHVFVVFTLRRRENHDVIRPISARYMHRKEIEHYEKAQEASEAQE